MAYGINTYFANGAPSFEMSDAVVQLIAFVAPATNSSGSMLLPGVVTVQGLRALAVTYDSLFAGGQKFNTALIEPNILQWSSRPYGGFIKPCSGVIFVVNKDV